MGRPSVLSPIILSSRVSLTNVAQSSDPSAINDDARGRPGDGRASTTDEPRDQPRLSAVCTVPVRRPDMRLSEIDSRRVATRETTPGTTQPSRASSGI